MRLALFFTRGVSLGQWERQGLFEREVALYRALRPDLDALAFVTYGGPEDLRFADRLPGIEILSNARGLPGWLYASFVPTQHRRTLEHATVLKTNQVKGAEVGLAARARFGAPLIVRSGYLWSLATREHRWKSWRGPWDALVAARRERSALSRAEVVSLTTPAMKEHVCRTYALPDSKVWVIPNYVLDGFFQVRAEIRTPSRRVLFVGRLEVDKNPTAVLEAAQGLDVEVTMIGQGSLRSALERRAAATGVRVRFVPSVPHRELSKWFRAADVFVLPSLREGHPKTLIEAMACGLPVVGADAPGIRDVIRNGETGVLAGPESGAIRAALAELLSNAERRERLGRNAREFVRERFAFDKILAAELALLNEVARGKTGHAV